MRDGRLVNSRETIRPEITGNTVLQSEILNSLTSAANYNKWLTDLAAPHLGDWPIELGSGLGDYAQTWLDSGTPRITVTELDPMRLGDLRARFEGDPRIEVEELDILRPANGDYSSLVAFNVLEHIPDDVQALRAAHRIVRPGGVVIIFVPAFSFAMSRFDRAVGHVRRYTKPGLHSVFARAGLESVDVRYVNMPGLLAWIVMMRLLGGEPKDSALLSLWDKHVIPASRRWDSRHRPPFGQSVLGIARVPTAK
jgi:SAM-dependent methyltransferase